MKTLTVRLPESLVAEMYDSNGPFRSVSTAGIAAWAAGATVFFAAGKWTGVGGTLPALATSILVYAVSVRREGPARAERGIPLKRG